MKYILSICLVLLSFQLMAQSDIDSLENVWQNNSEQDTSRMKALRLLIWEKYMYANPDTVLDLASKMEEIANVGGYDKYVANAKSLRGVAYSLKGEFVLSNDEFFAAKVIFEDIDYKLGLAAQNLNLGVNFKAMSDFPKATEYFLEAYKLYKEAGNELGSTNALNNVATIYMTQGAYEKARATYDECYKVYEKIGDIEGQVISLNNIGTNYHMQGKFEDAEIWYQKAVQVGLANDNKWGVAQAYVGLSEVLVNMKKHDLALDYLKGALELNMEMNSQEDIALVYLSMAKLFNNKKRTEKAIEAGKKALGLSDKIGAKYISAQTYYELFRAYQSSGKWKDALDMHLSYSKEQSYVDSLENKDAVTQMRFQHQYEQRAAEDSIRNIEERKTQEAQLAEAETDKENQKVWTYALLAVLGLALLFGGFAFNRFQHSKKQNEVIQEQKQKVDLAFDELEQKNNEILDSINYAKRIQSAILPPKQLVENYLNNSFILYQPKDIVAGDFYWMEPMEDRVLFAAADCTGHGVPGAMVSVVCNNALNRSVREFGLKKPGEILDKTREIVIREFEHQAIEKGIDNGNVQGNYSDQVIKDGMDIALCSLKGNKLKYAGAHNPLWIVRNGSAEMEEIKAEKQPIGKFSRTNPYPTHEVILNPGDTFYIFSDGFADQFGGEKGKKMKTSNFRQLLLEIQDKTMQDQRAFLENSFENWKGELEQLDDVCIIGVRV
jgi:serine phosphatase RsbU (regulator of sigma subunit)